MSRLATEGGTVHRFRKELGSKKATHKKKIYILTRGGGVLTRSEEYLWTGGADMEGCASTKEIQLGGQACNSWGNMTGLVSRET